MPVERDDPRRHGDKLEEPLRTPPKPRREQRRQTATSPGSQKPTPGSAEGERDVDDQNK